MKFMFRYIFLLKRVHSLSGIFPIGVYLCFHLFVNSFATHGPKVFNKIAGFLEGIPFVTLIAALLIWAPILFHAILGIYLCKTGSFNIGKYKYTANWMYVLQRITGFIGVVFIGVHWFQTRGSDLILHKEIGFSMMQEILRNPLFAIFYVAGMLSLVFHFANGIRTALITWGITVSPEAQRVGYFITIGVFVLLSFLGLSSIVAFRAL